jgi:hypothetical protein
MMRLETLHLGVDLVEVPRRRSSVGSPSRLRRRKERRLDDAEGVAQLVGDGGRELPEGREALGALEPGERVLAVGVEHHRELHVEQRFDRVDSAAQASCRGGLQHHLA